MSPSHEPTPSEPIFVVVPAYNEEAVVTEVVGELCSKYPNTVVVDDGSQDDTASKARDAGATVLRHHLNCGQGAALQTGITYALIEGAQIIVTFDADGQNRCRDIEALLSPLLRGEADACFGSRFWGPKSDVPWTRRILLRAAVLFGRLTSGVKLTDAHNGLRAFKRSVAESIDIKLDGMAHATEIVETIHRAGWKYTEVPVQIQYTAYSRSKGQRATNAFKIITDYFLERILR